MDPCIGAGQLKFVGVINRED